MITKLREIAAVHVGYPFRERLEPVQSGGVPIIQMKDLVEDVVKVEGLSRIRLKEPKQQHVVQVGDIVFRSRGITNTCALLKDEAGSAVLAAPLFRIRVDMDVALPEYVLWYINQRPTQEYLATHSRGTAQKMIGKDVLEDLDILVPPVKQQQIIVQAAELAEREQDLLGRLAGKRKQLVSAQLLRLAEGGSTR